MGRLSTVVIGHRRRSVAILLRDFDHRVDVAFADDPTRRASLQCAMRRLQKGQQSPSFGRPECRRQPWERGPHCRLELPPRHAETASGLSQTNGAAAENPSDHRCVPDLHQPCGFGAGDRIGSGQAPLTVGRSSLQQCADFASRHIAFEHERSYGLLGNDALRMRRDALNCVRQRFEASRCFRAAAHALRLADPDPRCL